MLNSRHFPIPERQRLDPALPGAASHEAGVADLVYDADALVWMTKRAPPVEQPQPQLTVRPISTVGPWWAVIDARGGFVIWRYRQPDFSHALEEKRRLCREYGWSGRHAYLERVRETPE